MYPVISGSVPTNSNPARLRTVLRPPSHPPAAVPNLFAPQLHRDSILILGKVQYLRSRKQHNSSAVARSASTPSRLARLAVASCDRRTRQPEAVVPKIDLVPVQQNSCKMPREPRCQRSVRPVTGPHPHAKLRVRIHPPDRRLANGFQHAAPIEGFDRRKIESSTSDEIHLERSYGSPPAFSTTSTEIPASRSSHARNRPTGPAPAITTSYFIPLSIETSRKLFPFSQNARLAAYESRPQKVQGNYP